jgi:LacI family transcriptional regulator
MAKSSSNVRVTIADIARESGVSPATVSLVLRDKPGIGYETRQRVMDCARSLGYIFTSSNPTNETAISGIGLIIKIDPSQESSVDQFYTPVLAGIEAFCRYRNINLLYAHMPVDADNNLLEVPRLLQEQTVDGLLLVGVWLNGTIMRVLKQQDIPTVLVDAYAPTNLFDAVLTDNEIGAYQAVSYLIENGHHHIAIVGSLPKSYPSIQERRAGYIKAMAEHNLAPYFIDCHMHSNEAVPATVAYLEQHPEITAVFSCNDEVAIGVIAALQAQGRRVPEDLSIIGFDNIALAKHITPALTTMRVDKMGMGRLAAQLLVNRIEYPTAGQVQTFIQPSLIERQSIAKSLPVSGAKRH